MLMPPTSSSVVDASYCVCMRAPMSKRRLWFVDVRMNIWMDLSIQQCVSTNVYFHGHTNRSRSKYETPVIFVACMITRGGSLAHQVTASRHLDRFTILHPYYNVTTRAWHQSDSILPSCDSILPSWMHKGTAWSWVSWRRASVTKLASWQSVCTSYLRAWVL